MFFDDDYDYLQHLKEPSGPSELIPTSAFSAPSERNDKEETLVISVRLYSNLSVREKVELGASEESTIFKSRQLLGARNGVSSEENNDKPHPHLHLLRVCAYVHHERAGRLSPGSSCQKQQPVTGLELLIDR